MLAVVDDEEEFARLEELDDAVDRRHARPRWRMQRHRDDVGECLVVFGLCELRDPRAVVELGKEIGGDLQRHASLPDAADAGDRDEAMVDEQLGDRLAIVLAADERRQLHGEVRRIRAQGRERPERRLDPLRAELIDALGFEQVPQSVLAEVAKLDTRQRAAPRRMRRVPVRRGRPPSNAPCG